MTKEQLITLGFKKVTDNSWEKPIYWYELEISGIYFMTQGSDKVKGDYLTVAVYEADDFICKDYNILSELIELLNKIQLTNL